jgi:GNAT superfamily N-acetyltransferase
MIRVREIRGHTDKDALLHLGRMHVDECMPNVGFSGAAVNATSDMILRDSERKLSNIWIAWLDEKPIGYALAMCSSYYWNFEHVAKMDMWYVVPEARGTWAAIKLVKAFEEWARLNGSRELYVGIARTDADEAKHIRRLFPRLGYSWCGSNYLKETVK